MEEKKKRWRPSLTAYRALESELAELKEANSKLGKECEALRRQLGSGGQPDMVFRDTYDALLIKTDNERRNMLAEISRLSDALDECRAECKRLVNRSFFARLLNK